MKQYNIDGVNIYFDPAWKDISISLSGGADSCLLTYILLDIIRQEQCDTHVHIISHTRMWKTRPWQEYDSLRIFNELSRIFNVSMTRHKNFVAPDLEYGYTGNNMQDEYGKTVSGDNIQIRSYSEYICNTLDIPAYYNAVTRNPKNKDFGGMESRDIEQTNDNHHLLDMDHMGRKVFHPFRFTQKDWVVKQYRNRNIMDLFELTRSCEGEFKDITHRTYKAGQYVPLCNECFWCLEREWAINESK